MSFIEQHATCNLLPSIPAWMTLEGNTILQDHEDYYHSSDRTTISNSGHSSSRKAPVQHGLKGLLALPILLLPRFIAASKDEWWSCSQYPQLLNIFVPVSMLQMHLYTQVMLILVTWNNNRLLGYCTRRVDAPGWLEHVFFPMHLYHTIWSNDL